MGTRRQCQARSQRQISPLPPASTLQDPPTGPPPISAPLLPPRPPAGGWPGGEAGLWKLREEVLAEKQRRGGAPGGGSSGARAPAKPAVPRPQGDKKPIYVGYGKRWGGTQGGKGRRRPGAAR